VKKQGLLSLTGIALLGLIVLMTLHEWDYATPPAPEQRPDVPTLVLEHLDATRHGESGEPIYRITANGLAWFEVTDRSTLDAPRVEMFGNKGRWLIEAKKGEMRQSEKIIDLQGEVRAQREGDAPLSLETAQLVYHADDERLVVPTPVVIRHEGGETRAGQLDADLRNGVMTMADGVETRYAPTPR